MVILLNNVTPVVQNLYLDDPENTENNKKMYRGAVALIDQSQVPPGYDPMFGCAISMNEVHRKIFGHPIGGGAATRDLVRYLRSDPTFKEVLIPLPGDIVISPTDYSRLPNPPFVGHVGLIGKHCIMSNNSYNGLWQTKYTLNSWKKRYYDLGGYPMLFFRKQ